MTVRITATGRAGFARLAHALHEAGEKGLKRELDKGSRDAGQVLVDEVKKNTATYIPKQFERTWDTDFRTKVEVRLVASRRVTAVFWAVAHAARRDIEAINAGRLRHPVFGRTRPLKRHWIHKATSMVNPWVEQAIRPGLVDEPAQQAMPAAMEKIEDALTRVVQQIERTG